jgi:hypothetical protein
MQHYINSGENARTTSVLQQKLPSLGIVGSHNREATAAALSLQQIIAMSDRLAELNDVHAELQVR